MKKLIVLLSFFLTGCWNYAELNDLAITTGMAIDKVDNEYMLTVMIANSKKQESSGNNSQASTAVYEGKGETIFEAGKDVALKVAKQIYIGHIEVVVISEEIAKNDLLNCLDFLARYPQVRNEFYLIIANNSIASDILKITTPLESFPSQNISKNLEVTNRLQGIIYSVTFNDLLKDILEEGKNPILPSVILVGDPNEGNKPENIEKNKPEVYLELNNLGIFKKDKFIAFADEEESIGINFLNNKINSALIPLKFDDTKVNIELNTSKTKFKLINDNKIQIEIKVDGSITEATNNIDLEDKKSIEKIKEETNKEITNLVSKAIDLAKKNKTDIFGFGNLIYKNNYKYWYTVKDNWDDLAFLNLEFEIKIKSSIETKGNSSNIIKEG